jgi:pimeloyl-ACP methyl ester carboxylesterase
VTRTTAGIAWELEGSGPFALLVHGLSLDRRSFRPVRDRLSCASLAPDLPGHGESRPSRGGIDDAVEALRAVVAEAGEPAIVAGHSLGALVALALAAERRLPLVVLDQPLRLGAWLRDVQRRAAGGGGATPDLGAFRHALSLDVLPPPAREHVEAAVSEELLLQYWGPLLERDPDELDRETERALRAVPRVVSLHGRAAPEGYAGWLSSLTRSEVEVWPGAGHYPHLTDPERVARCLQTRTA